MPEGSAAVRRQTTHVRAVGSLRRSSTRFRSGLPVRSCGALAPLLRTCEHAKHCSASIGVSTGHQSLCRVGICELAIQYR